MGSQLRRAAVSIPSNIAEGSRYGDKQFAHFLSIAHGSCAEVETLLLLSEVLCLPYQWKMTLTDSEFTERKVLKEKSETLLSLTNEVSKMILSFKETVLEKLRK
jgi:hypothetical protein